MGKFLAPSSPFAKMGFGSRRPSALLRFIIPAFVIICIWYYLSEPKNTSYFAPKGKTEQVGTIPDIHHGAGVDDTRPVPDHNAEDRPANIPPPPAASQAPTVPTGPGLASGNHPIDIRIRAAEAEFAEKVSRQSGSLEEAAAAYRKRRGRHPPPGFKEWYEFAVENDAIMIEDFWDQIYHDLEPFWALEPSRIRKDAWEFEMRINIRNHKASSGSTWFWTKIWLSLIETIEHLLPDMDIALNAMDEPRMVVPFEKIDEYMTEAHKTRYMKDPASVVSNWGSLIPSEEDPEPSVEKSQRVWDSGKETKHYWLTARRGCPPQSPARMAEVLTDFDKTPSITSSFAVSHMERGFVKNYTLSTEFCHQPDLQGLNGIFVEPLSVSATDDLFPLFGGSKLAVNNEILLPAPMYWNEEERFMGKSDGQNLKPWNEKRDSVIWRGVATGGKNRENNWKAFQRHRFVAMNNATKLTRAEEWVEFPNNFALPPSGYGLKAVEENRLGEWVGSWANVSFVDLMCAVKQEVDVLCNYTDPYFSVNPGVKMDTQFGYKYLPDIDGNSFSGRYLGFLRSTSLPIKSTLWREWHDSRLVAWKHFVPMDSRFTDWYGIMEYFIGYEGKDGKKVAGHDKEAERIALAGQEWANKALRKEDMKVYVLRLLLEYARISNDKRESMGWVGDLAPSGSGRGSGSGSEGEDGEGFEEREDRVT